jgi:hypothetical protein
MAVQGADHLHQVYGLRVPAKLRRGGQQFRHEPCGSCALQAQVRQGAIVMFWVFWDSGREIDWPLLGGDGSGVYSQGNEAGRAIARAAGSTGQS